MGTRNKHQHPVFAETHGEFTWCLHCECVYRTESWINNNWECPDKQCNGNAIDAFSWHKDSWPRNVHPEYPEVPEDGKEYPLY